MGGDDWDPNEEYVTRCICGFTHDDGYMICCDGCSVWQHIECMQVDPNNVPDKYMCEHCEPRPTDKKRARLIQLKKREDISEVDEEDDDAALSSDELHKVSRRKKRKASAASKPVVADGKPPPVKRTKEDTKEPEKKKMRKRSVKASTSVKMPHHASIGLEDTLMQDLWDISLSPWSDKFENIHQSRYTEQVKAIIALKSQQIKSEAISYSKEEYNSIEAKRPLAKFTVSEVQKRRRGVLSHTSLTMYELVMEYKGKFTLRNVVTAELGITGKFLWKHRPCPYVYCYDKIPGIDLCIDARQQGNLARFMRRSCSPNSELKHMLVNNELKIGVFALSSIKAGSEITLPFDFPYEHCDYPVDCACNQGMSCQVMRANFTIVNRMQIGRFIPVNDENQPYEEDGWSRGGSRSSEVLPQSSSQLLHHRHWQNKRGSSHSQSPPTTTSSLSTLLPESDSIDSDDDSVLVEQDTSSMISGIYSKRHKGHQPGSEGHRKEFASKFLDGVELPVKGQHYCTPEISPLHSYQMRANSRKGSQAVGQKVRLLPLTNKYNHQDSDVGDSLSPPLQAPSPDQMVEFPYTPLPDMGFKVTSHLHPKFLIAKFPLPRKKAILKKWEEERTNEKDLILNGHICKNLGCEFKGSLKQRLLKLYNHNRSSNGLTEAFDNKTKEITATFSFPIKKYTLLKWKTLPPDHENKLAVNETNLAGVVLNETESCGDDKIESMDSSKPKEVFDEVSSDSKIIMDSNPVIHDKEVMADDGGREERAEELESKPVPCESVSASDVASVVTEKLSPTVEKSFTTSRLQTDATTVDSAPLSPKSPELVADHLPTHVCDPVSNDASELGGERTSEQHSDTKTGSGTDTPQQGKRKKVSLLEYRRNKARKSTDHRKSTDTPHSSGQNSPVSPSAPLTLLSEALTSLVSQFPASSLQSTLSSTLLGIGASLSESAASIPECSVAKENSTPLPQFEAISPGDSDDNWDTTPLNSQDEDSLAGPLPTGLALSSLMFGRGSLTSNLSPYSPMTSQFHLHSQQWPMDDDKSLQQHHHFSAVEEQQKTPRQDH